MMMTYLRSLVVLGAIVLAGACEGDNKLEPGGDGGVDGSTACTANSECMDPTAICDVGRTNVCVQCLEDMDETACGGTTPICAGTSCLGCSSHSECPDSDTCLPDGSCAAKDAVVYLDAAGAGGPGCGAKDAKCGKGTEAIGKVSAAKPYLRVTGTIMDGDMMVPNSNKNVTILGDATAVLKGTVVLDIKGSAAVKVYDIRIEDASDLGVKTDNDGSSVELYRTKVLRSKNEGVLVIKGKASIVESEISGTMEKRGVNLVSGEILVFRSKVASNLAGGIAVADGQKFTITNSFIVGNKANGGFAAEGPGAGSVFAFNTVADNENPGTGAADAGGVYCDGPTFTFSNNIIFRNIGGNGGFLQTVGNCKFDGSFLSPNDAAETRILGFVKDTAPRDYHLTAASPASVRDVAGTVCTDQVDYDGESRPQGAACDLGADEYKVP